MTVVTILYVTANGQTISATQQPGNSPGAVGGFDVQRAGTNSFCAVDQAVYRATSLGGAYSLYYSIAGGAQAPCIIIPYFSWSGVNQISATNPDIVAALNQSDGTGTLKWIEGGATPGTVHDITPVAGITFNNANCVTTSYQHHIACFGLVGGVYKLYVTINQGSSWTLVETLTGPTFIRCRRNDNRAAVSGSAKGQLYTCENGQGVIDYSSKWGTAGIFPRIMPVTNLDAFDTVF